MSLPEPTDYGVSVYPLGQAGPLGSDQWVEWGEANPGYVPYTVSFVSGLAVKSLWFPAPQGPMSFYAGDSATGTPFYVTDGAVAELVPIPNDAPVVTISGPSAMFWFYASSVPFTPFSAGTPPVLDIAVIAPIVNEGTSSAPVIALATPLAVAYGGSGQTAPSLIAGANITISGAWPNQTINATQGAGGVQTVSANEPLYTSGGAQNPTLNLRTPLVTGYGGTGIANPYLKGGLGITVNGSHTIEDATFQWELENTGVLSLSPGAVTGAVVIGSVDGSVNVTNPGGGQEIDLSVDFFGSTPVYGKRLALTGTNPSGTITLGPLPAGTYLLEAYVAGLDAAEGTAGDVATISLSTGANGGMDGSQYTRYIACADEITSAGSATPSATLTCSGTVTVNSHASAAFLVFKATLIGH